MKRYLVHRNRWKTQIQSHTVIDPWFWHRGQQSVSEKRQPLQQTLLAKLDIHWWKNETKSLSLDYVYIWLSGHAPACACVPVSTHKWRPEGSIKCCFFRGTISLALWDRLPHWDPWLMDEARLEGQWALGIYCGESGASQCWDYKHMLPQTDVFKNMGPWNWSQILKLVQEALGKLCHHPGPTSHSVNQGFL